MPPTPAWRSASGAQASGPAIPLEQLAGASFIDFPPGWGNRAVVDRAFAAAGLDRQVPFEVADFAAAAGLIRRMSAAARAFLSELPADGK
jgi:DNA-binding transcriptional LysR family regulator